MAFFRRVELSPGAFIDVDRAFLAREEADAAFAVLRNEIDWRQEHIVLFGKRIAQPRLSRWMGDEGADYTYSGVKRTPCPWHPLVRSLGERAARASGVTRFNSVLLNLYRDGKDSMGFHADDERELGDAPIIASVSLGATRTFVLRTKRKQANGKRVQYKLLLEHGSLVVMHGALQRDWTHAIPKELVQDERINLTYRVVA